MAAVELPRNTMTIVELEGHALADLLAAVRFGDPIRTLRVAVEVEPDGTTYVKHKVGESTWSHPYELGREVADVRVERLYDDA